MTHEQIAELERLEKEAEPGPWEWWPASPADFDDKCQLPHVPQGAYLGETLINLSDTYEGRREDCALVVALRNAAPDLIAAAKEAATLRAQVARLREALAVVVRLGNGAVTGEEWAMRNRAYATLKATERCDHGVTFDQEAARVLLPGEVRKRWPRLHGTCPKGCGFVGIAYASDAHYTYGDW